MENNLSRSAELTLCIQHADLDRLVIYDGENLHMIMHPTEEIV